ncbi:glycosyl hydrolase-related protein [Calidithermus chliarophilus]|uniref:glycosyl hydrolase-related protein n=1 Tax=Calidithermus chliarophilus TaxID=52023 RepID=UPI0012F65E72|nr:glycosyl hydrolase-related protein [Calidithermus chliarophilus]
MSLHPAVLRWRYRLFSGASVGKAEATRRGLYARRISRICFQDFREVKEPYAGAAGGTLARLEGPVIPSTLRAARDGRGFVLRVKEVEGKGGEARFWLPGRRVARAWATDLLERERRPLEPDPGGGLRFPVKARGFATVRSELEGA